MDKKKMTKKGTRWAKRLLAAVCTVVLVLGLMPGNLGTISVQAETTKINLTGISTNKNNPTNVPAGSIIENNQNVELKISIYAAINDWDNSSAYDFVVDTLKIDEKVTINTSYSQGNSRTISANIWQAYYDYSSDQVRMWLAADTKTETTTTLSAASITVTEGETWELTAQATADGTNIDGATVVYYSDEDFKTKLADVPTAVGTYYARGEYYGSDSYEASNSEIITVTIKEKTKDYNYTMAELLKKGTTKLAAGTRIYQDERIFDQGQYAGSYEYGIAKGYITDDSSKVQNYETYKDDYSYIKSGYKHDIAKGKIITLRNSYVYDKGSGKTITGEEWYVYVTKFGETYVIKIMPTSPTEGYIKEVTAPTISDDGQPTNASVKSGETAKFTVTATGDDLTYQWQIDRNDGNGFVNIDGATATSYTASAVDTSYSGYKYHCIVTNTAGSVTSNDAILTVTADEPEPHTHTLVYHAEVAATTIKAGTKAYWQCSDCGKYFSDAEGKTEIEKPEIIPIIAAKDDGSDKGSDDGSDGKDATTTTTTETTTTETTTTETAAADTTGTTASGSAAANTAAASDSPKTGDGTPIAWLFALMLVCGCGAYMMIEYRKSGRND